MVGVGGVLVFPEVDRHRFHYDPPYHSDIDDNEFDRSFNSFAANFGQRQRRWPLSDATVAIFCIRSPTEGLSLKYPFQMPSLSESSMLVGSRQ